jgi:hypothetical protein
MTSDNQRFVIRHNLDGSYDSICLRCFRTVATSVNQAELLAFERNHRCETNPAAEMLMRFPPAKSIKPKPRVPDKKTSTQCYPSRAS